MAFGRIRIVQVTADRNRLGGLPEKENNDTGYWKDERRTWSPCASSASVTSCDTEALTSGGAISAAGSKHRKP